MTPARMAPPCGITLWNVVRIGGGCMATADRPPPEARVGLVADPDFPHRVARHLRAELPEIVNRWLGVECGVELVVDPVTAGRHDSTDIMKALLGMLRERDWDYAVCVTDLPLTEDGVPVLAEAVLEPGVGVVSLPALGGSQPYRRAQQLVSRVFFEFGESGSAGLPPGGLASRLTRLLAPIHRSTPTSDGVDVRYSGTRLRGRVRLLTGMVRGNSPWRLLPGMASALAAALATAAYAMISSSIWLISDSLGPWRLGVGAVWAIAIMTVWLVVAHHLWEPRRHSPEPGQALLYNASTLLTLGIGVACLYGALFCVDLVAAAFLITPGVLARELDHPVGPATYVIIAASATAMGVVAGAVGSTLESDTAVRRAAYGYREEKRQADRARTRRDRRHGRTEAKQS